LVYGEGHLNKTRFQTADDPRWEADLLLGSQWSPEFLGARVSVEFFRNGYGLGGGAGGQRRREMGKLRGDSRARVYAFPSPGNFRRPTAGIGSFFSRDLVFIDVRGQGLGSSPFLAALASLNDLSLLSIAGYRWAFSGSDEGGALTLEWRRFLGGDGSEFGEAAKRIGQNQFWVTLSLR
jgi:hypothetical protein